MKVLIVSAYDTKGGAARATYRLHKSLLAQNINSQMLVQNKHSNDPTVIGAKSKIRQFLINPFRPALDHILMKLYGVNTLFSSSYLSFSEIVQQINKINPDIVHLHWICGGMMRIEDMAKIKAPIVWSLHDNWAFTGGCHIMWGCEKYKNNCGSCPRLNSHKQNDLSRKVFNRKQKVFSKIDNMTIVGVSRWLNDCAKNSRLLKDKKHIHLPNPIDTNIFKPFGKTTARELWDLPQDKKLILFGANSATSDINKGFKELSEALCKLTNKNIELVIFGASKPKNPQSLGFKTHYLGVLNDDVSLATLYSAADVMLIPSLQEAFGQTASEAMACKTPVVAFGHTGLLDIVDHKKNGYLAKPFDTTDLKDGIEWVLNNTDYDTLCDNARAKVLSEFDSAVVAKKYINLYQTILEDRV